MSRVENVSQLCCLAYFVIQPNCIGKQWNYCPQQRFSLFYLVIFTLIFCFHFVYFILYPFLFFFPTFTYIARLVKTLIPSLFLPMVSLWGRLFLHSTLTSFLWNCFIFLLLIDIMTDWHTFNCWLNVFTVCCVKYFQ